MAVALENAARLTVACRGLPWAALGGHVERCEDCAHERITYNSYPRSTTC